MFFTHNGVIQVFILLKHSSDLFVLSVFFVVRRLDLFNFIHKNSDFSHENSEIESLGRWGVDYCSIN